MNKKTWLKVLTATAIASSAVVVTNPAAAASVSEAEKLVQTAKDAGTVLKWAISIEGTADGKTRPWKAYNDAKSAYEMAAQAVNKLTSTSDKVRLSAELEEHVKIHITRCMHYIDAITAGEKIREKQELLQAQLNLNAVNDATEKLYHELSAEIRKQGVLLDRVYGKSTRDLIRSQYKESAEQVRDRARYPVTVKMELDLTEKALTAKKYDEAEKHFLEAEKYIQLVTNTSMKNQLLNRMKNFDKNFVPKVEKISAVEPYRIMVQFNKEMMSGHGTYGAENRSNYSVSGHTIKSVKLSDDRKTAIIELTYPLSSGTTYSVTVKKNIQTANNKSLGESYTTTFKFIDNVKPTVTLVNSELNGTLTIKFSELISKNSPLRITVNGKQVQHNSLSYDTDQVVISKAELDKLGLQRGRSYSISISGAYDLASPNPNTMNQYSKTFIYNPAPDVTAPELYSLQVKGENGFTVQFSETLRSFSAANMVITKGNMTIRPSSVKDISDGARTKFEVTLPNNVYGNDETRVYLLVEFKDIKDVEGNTAPQILRSLTIEKDVTVPKLVSSTFDINSNEIQITMSKELQTGSPDRNKITIYNKDNEIVQASVKANNGNKIIIDARNLPDGTYTIAVGQGAVKDNTLGQNGNEGFVTTVTKKMDVVPPTAYLIKSDNNGEFKIYFNEEVDENTLKGYGNILIDNNYLPTNTSFSFSADKRLVTVTLPAGSIPITKMYTITLRNITDLSDNVMPTYREQVEIKQN